MAEAKNNDSLVASVAHQTNLAKVMRARIPLEPAICGEAAYLIGDSD